MSALDIGCEGRERVRCGECDESLFRERARGDPTREAVQRLGLRPRKCGPAPAVELCDAHSETVDEAADSRNARIETQLLEEDDAPNVSNRSGNRGGLTPRRASAVDRKPSKFTAHRWTDDVSTSSPSVLRREAAINARLAVELAPLRMAKRGSGSSIEPRLLSSTSEGPSDVDSTRRYRSPSQMSTRFVGRRCNRRTMASR